MLKHIPKTIRQGLLWLTAALALVGCDSNFKTVGTSPSANMSSVSLSSSSTVQNTAVTATITLKDEDGNAVPGFTPVVSVSPSGASVSCSESDSSGVSSCSLSSSTANTYTATVTSPVQLSAVTFTVYQKPTTISFTTQPAGIASGVTFASNVAVQVLDINGAALTSVQPGTVVTLTITGTDSTAAMTLGGVACASTGCTASIVAGTSTFTNLTVDKVGIYNLIATAGSATATSSSFGVTHGAATQIAFTTQPSSSAIVNRVITQMPGVKVEDAAGNTVTGDPSDSSVVVSLSLLGCAGATLISDAVVATGGVADFSDAGIRFSAAAAQAGCQLQASATILAGAVTATSDTMSIAVPGANSKVSIDSGLSSTAAATVTFGSQPIVYITDSTGNINTDDYTTTVTMAKGASSTGSGLLNGTVTGTAVAGVVTFTDLNFDLAGTYFLTATSGTLTMANSSAITVSALGTASQLVISQQPEDSAVSTAFQPGSVVVKILDSNGNLVNTSTANVTATLATGSGTLGGTTTVAAVGGVATFTDLNINAVGGGKSITFASSGTTSVTSSTFNVYSVGTARKLVFATQPSQSSTNNVAFGTQPVVKIVDEHGLVVDDDVTVVTLGCAFADAGCAAVNNNTATATDGIATFVNSSYSAADTNVVLQATGGGLTPTYTKPNLRAQ